MKKIKQNKQTPFKSALSLQEGCERRAKRFRFREPPERGLLTWRPPCLITSVSPTDEDDLPPHAHRAPKLTVTPRCHRPPSPLECRQSPQRWLSEQMRLARSCLVCPLVTCPQPASVWDRPSVSAAVHDLAARGDCGPVALLTVPPSRLVLCFLTLRFRLSVFGRMLCFFKVCFFKHLSYAKFSF